MSECRFLEKKLGGYRCTAVEPVVKLSEKEVEKCRSEEFWKECRRYKDFFIKPKFKFV